MNPRRRLWLRNQARKTNEVITTIEEETNTIEDIVHQALAEEPEPEIKIEVKPTTKVEAKNTATKKARTTRKRVTSKKK
jgi:hypothetical protein